MTDLEVFLQQLITGLSNGMIIALIAIGYTLVYGIVELINFAHGDLVMLGAFMALTLVGLVGVDVSIEHIGPALLFFLLCSGVFCGVVNWGINRLFYKPIRNSPRLTQLVTALGISFVFINIGLFWGGMPLSVFGGGGSAASQKDFPSLISYDSVFGDSAVQLTMRDILVIGVTIPLMLFLTYFVRKTKWGTAMRAVAQNPSAAGLMGIDVERIIGYTFFLGGFLGGIAAVVYSLYNNTIYFQMGYRIGIDGFTAAVLGGIGHLPGAVLGGLLIGLLRAFVDQYLATMWTNIIVFLVLILVLVFRPAGLLGAKIRDKV